MSAALGYRNKLHRIPHCCTYGSHPSPIPLLQVTLLSLALARSRHSTRQLSLLTLVVVKPLKRIRRRTTGATNSSLGLDHIATNERVPVHQLHFTQTFPDIHDLAFERSSAPIAPRLYTSTHPIAMFYIMYLTGMALTTISLCLGLSYHYRGCCADAYHDLSMCQWREQPLLPLAASRAVPAHRSPPRGN